MNSLLHRSLLDCISPSLDVDEHCPNEESLYLIYSNSYRPFPYPSRPLQEEREQALRDYKICIEFKHLKQHAPGGVYLVPSLNDHRHFYGVIFIRRGPYTNGIFKFQVRLPEQYNSLNSHPEITFSSYVYNPHVDPITGILDIKTAYPRWDPHRHYLVTVLTHLKKIFYVKTFGDDANSNPDAKRLSESDPEAYRKQVDHCVRESQKAVFVNDPGCTLRFTEETLAHQVLRDLLQRQVTDPNQVNKQVILNIVDKASKV